MQPWVDGSRSYGQGSLGCGPRPASTLALNRLWTSYQANQLWLHQETTTHKRVSVTRCSVLGQQLIGCWFLQQGNLPVMIPSCKIISSLKIKHVIFLREMFFKSAFRRVCGPKLLKRHTLFSANLS